MLAIYFVASLLASLASARNAADLVGTWTTKSRQVFTGPGFYDPILDELIEPKLTGVSFSFTSDGYFEEAFYRAVSNPQDPSCPKGIMQWQHGTYTVGSGGSLHLKPFPMDGRQLVSDPCSSAKGLYSRYNQTEEYNSFTVGIDPYYDSMRLDLYSFDGSPMIPMYLAYKPPEMLPAEPLESIRSKRAKRHIDVEATGPFDLTTLVSKDSLVDPDRWLWMGVVMSAMGGVALFFS
ncbi:Protein rot1 [Aspergillus mulundensis]|uniref:Protein ROT1 n=1 Tax=Aspergillus mulundensis TaxID=1810919 RepID=A0A3D8SBK1_9EURO|nr:Protein rot1 [Aspergillus mulundensis]RDW83690.1 Protein rot1 [Aspergillus mulundensis]